jgi:UrcA family protein
VNAIRLSNLVLSAVVALATLGIAVSPAIAAAPTAAPARTVRFGDLNLSSNAGLAALHRRLEEAAADVCGPAEVPGSRRISPAYQDCVSDAVHRAVLQINRPEVTAYHVARIVRHLLTAAR